MITLYGIPNCDTVKKARTWLTDHGMDYTFHDFKKQGVPEARLDHWIAALGWEKLVNRQGTTWRQLPDEVKASITDDAAAIQLMLDKPSVIKRPVLDIDGKITLGFDAATYESLLTK